MKTSLCQALDDYLDHDLAPAESVRFVAHLSECPSCRQAVAEHQRLENLLGETVARLETAPGNLVMQIEGGLRLARRRRWVAAAAALAATAATICLVARQFPRIPEPDLPMVKVAIKPPVIAAPLEASPVRIKFPAGA